ncbi:hypothetical protein F4780DRAFT_292841 [Xylariomycetidae sp. FL0641]|nr:hypothetical protein F4780DRAFT_292841 [Xylariomycetidae sp. FL0641]
MAAQLTAAEANATLQPNLIALCTAMVVLSTLALGLRLWSNCVSPGYRWWWDDLFAAIALPFIVSETALIFWWISLGLGKHAATVPPEDLAQGPKVIFIAAFLYDCSISIPKFSALFFYRRIFATTSKWFTIALWTVGAMNAGWLLSALISTVFQCTPINAAWETVPGSTCISQWGWFFGTAIPSMIIDAFILLLPMPLLWGLQAPVSRRIIVGSIFLCGYGVIVASVGRLVTLASAGDHLLDDLTWTTITYLEWVQVEGPISLTSVCLPSILRLIKRIHDKGIRGAFPDRPRRSKEFSGQFVRMDEYSVRTSHNGTVKSQSLGDHCMGEAGV